MQRELIDEASFKKIISNQTLIIQDLDKSYTSIHSLLQLSNKYLPQAVNSFKIGQQHITKIRSNLDYIHKVMLKIKKKLKTQKEQQKIKQQQISTITQAMKNVMDQYNKDNFLQTNGQSQQLIEVNKEEINYDNSLSNTLQVDQIDKLMAYYKLDETETFNQEVNIEKSDEKIKTNSFNLQQQTPFVLLGKNKDKQQKQQFQQYKYQGPLI